MLPVRVREKKYSHSHGSGAKNIRYQASPALPKIAFVLIDRIRSISNSRLPLALQSASIYSRLKINALYV